MKLRYCYLFLLLAAIPAASQPLRLASFHVSEFSEESDIERIADIVQQYDMVAIQDLRDLAATDALLATLFRRGDFFKVLPSNPSSTDGTRYAFAWRDRSVQLIAPGSFLEIGSEYRPAYATFRAGNFDFIAVIYQTASPAAQASKELVETYHKARETRADEGDVLLFSSLAEPTPVPAPLTPIVPLDAPVALDGSSAHANIYIAAYLTGEYSGNYAIDSFELNLPDADAQRVSQRRPVWAEFIADSGDDDGPGIPLPSAIDFQTWGQLKAAKNARSN